MAIHPLPSAPVSGLPPERLPVCALSPHRWEDTWLLGVPCVKAWIHHIANLGFAAVIVSEAFPEAWIMGWSSSILLMQFNRLFVGQEKARAASPSFSELLRACGLFLHHRWPSPPIARRSQVFIRWAAWGLFVGALLILLGFSLDMAGAMEGEEATLRGIIGMARQGPASKNYSNAARARPARPRC